MGVAAIAGQRAVCNVAAGTRVLGKLDLAEAAGVGGIGCGCDWIDGCCGGGGLHGVSVGV